MTTNKLYSSYLESIKPNPERRIEALSRFRSGEQISSIAKSFDVTSQCVRQHIMKALYDEEKSKLKSNKHSGVFGGTKEHLDSHNEECFGHLKKPENWTKTSD